MFVQAFICWSMLFLLGRNEKSSFLRKRTGLSLQISSLYPKVQILAYTLMCMHKHVYIHTLTHTHTTYNTMHTYTHTHTHTHTTHNTVHTHTHNTMHTYNSHTNTYIHKTRHILIFKVSPLCKLISSQDFFKGCTLKIFV